MPLFTSLLFFFIALALVPLAMRNSALREARRKKARDEQRIEIGTRICEAAARDAFGIELDHSLASIDTLDDLITQGWMDGTSQPNDEHPLSFVMGSYLGDIYVQNRKAEWKHDDEEAILYFPEFKRRISPFELIRKKLNDPAYVHLDEETARWQAPPEMNDAIPTA